MHPGNQQADCRSEDIAAFIDGELLDDGLKSFEAHLTSCHHCADELRTQRQLLCTLNVAFNETPSFDLPRDFSRVVTARAESDVRGLRGPGERRRALHLCIALAVISFGLMGAATRGLVFDPLKSFFKVAETLIDLMARAALDLGQTAAVFLRVIVRAVLFAPYGLGVLFMLTLLFSILLLPFLIFRYHRAQIIE